MKISTVIRRSAVVTGAFILMFFSFRSMSSQETPGGDGGIRFTTDNRLVFPADYREWTFLSAGRGMSYGPSADRTGPAVFDNVFVNPAAYRAFLKTGSWPERTIFVLEIRDAATEGSINKGGRFQKDIRGVEVEVKDQRFTSTRRWAFFAFGTDQEPAAQIPGDAGCYTCHRANGAVEQTFVQFYPTLLPVARAQHTLKER